MQVPNQQPSRSSLRIPNVFAYLSPRCNCFSQKSHNSPALKSFASMNCCRRLPISLFFFKSAEKRAMSTSSESYHGLGYVDVHCHLIHDKFKGIEDEIALKCKTAGMDFVVVNGLEPISNRQVLELCNKHKPYLLPALGIYPLDAACNVITEANWNHPFPPPEKFDVDAEVDFIDEMAGNKLIAAVGECGLDKHYLTDDTSMQEQERVLRKLMKVMDACWLLPLFCFAVVTVHCPG